MGRIWYFTLVVTPPPTVGLLRPLAIKGGTNAYAIAFAGLIAFSVFTG
jgi:hypothetical protein